MGSKVSVDELRGILLPDTRLEVWDAQTGEYNAGVRVGPLPTAGAHAGVPTATSTPTPKMRLRAIGDQTAGSVVDVRCVRGGLPAPGGAGIAYKSASASEYFGWDSVSVLGPWEPIAMGTAGSAGQRDQPHVCALASGEALGVYRVRGLSADYSVYDVVRAVDGTWTERTLHTGGERDSAGSPCVVELTGGRALCFAWMDDQVEESATVRMWYTDDLTSAWKIGSRHTLPERVDTSTGTTGWILNRLRVAVGHEQVLLLASMRTRDTGVAGAHDVLIQYASSDGGNRFVEVCRTSTALTSPQKQGAAYHDVVFSRGSFYVGYIDVGDARAKVARVGSAFEPFLGGVQVETGPSEPSAVVDGGGDYHTDGDLVLVADEIGTVYLYHRLVNESNPWMVCRTIDDGASWQVMTPATTVGEPGAAMALLDSASYPRDAAGCWLDTRVLLLHGAASSPSALGGGSVWAAYLGGPATVTMPISRQQGDGEPDITTWHGTYLPIDLPQDVGWTRTTGGGAPTQSIATGVLEETLAAGETAYYDRTITGSVDGGAIVRAAVDVSGGVAVVRVRLADATEGYEIVVSVSATTVSCSDGISGGAVGSAATHGGDEVELLIGLRGASATVWYRDWSTEEEITWVQVATTAALTDSAGGVTTNRLRWGCIATAASSRTHTWRGVYWVTDAGVATRDYLGEGLASPPSNPSDLSPRSLGSVPVSIGFGVKVWGVDGPAYRGDEWQIEVGYDHELADVLPHVEPSPARGWRSAARTTFDATTTHLHLAFRVVGGEDVLPGNDLWALWLDDMNFGSALFDVYTGGAWSNVATVSKTSFSGDRRGSTLRPAAASALGTRVRRGELDGSGVVFVSGGGTVVDWVGECTSNTEGTLAPAGATARRAILRLDGTTALLSATPTVEIWPRRALILLHASGVAAAIEGIRLRVPVSTGTALPGVPLSGDYRLGLMAFGPLWVAGMTWSYDRTVAVEAQAEIVTLADGTRRVRTLARPRRRVGVNWVDGADLTDVRSNTSPDYVTGSENASAEGVAFWGDVPLSVHDLYLELQGPNRTVLLLPRVDRDTASGASGDAQVVIKDWAGEALYGRVTSPVTINQVMGEELRSEIFRTLEFVVEEEQ